MPNSQNGQTTKPAQQTTTTVTPTRRPRDEDIAELRPADYEQGFEPPEHEPPGRIAD